MLTVCCVWVKANVPYSVEYVTRLHAMCKRWIDRPFRFVCFTDQPWAIPDGIERAIVAHPKDMSGWWAKVNLFDKSRDLQGRILYLDLDTLIVSNLDCVIDYPAPFALVPHAGTFQGRNGLSVVKRFNSSVMAWDAGTQDHVFNNWVPKVTKRLWGDQDFIGEQCPFAATFPPEWFPRISDLTVSGSLVIPDTAKVVLVKKPKCEEAALKWSNFREAWA